ncbi:MAG: hypothetical protein J0I21_04305 [Alphaproteobacteria bacterium]|nr:hypothetical protein [Alphaproteobacteria bacterium]
MSTRTLFLAAAGFAAALLMAAPGRADPPHGGNWGGHPAHGSRPGWHGPRPGWHGPPHGGPRWGGPGWGGPGFRSWAYVGPPAVYYPPPAYYPPPPVYYAPPPVYYAPPPTLSFGFGFP